MPKNVYQWLILQQGHLPLRVDGSVDLSAEHACTATLIWPAGVPPDGRNTLLVDPSFPSSGYRAARRRLQRLGLALADVGFVFSTHEHWDHLPRLPSRVTQPRWRPFQHGCAEALAGIDTVACPGHDPELRAVRFRTAAGEVWAVGDAILGADWLRTWMYYWPNDYDRADIVQTWLSVARILAHADTILPGHGPAIEVTPGLLEELIASFPSAAYGEDCPEVPKVLQQRLLEW
jgi:glyoxylase-like metal-dependent hydrolase (beta-lactamase superfamily II)